MPKHQSASKRLLDIILDSIQQDGSWISNSGYFRSFKPEDQLKHKMVYTSNISKTLNPLDTSIQWKKKVLSFIESYREIDDEMYDLYFKCLICALIDDRDKVDTIFPRLFSLIEHGGVVNFDGRKHSKFFDDCFALSTIVSILNIYPDINVDNDRFSSLSRNIFDNVTSGNDVHFWIWRWRILSEVTLISDIFTRANIIACQDRLNSNINQIISQIDSPEQKISKIKSRSVTPDIFAKEMPSAYFIENIAVLANNSWIALPENSQLLSVLSDKVSHLWGEFEDKMFYSTTLSKREGVNRCQDLYVNASILRALSALFQLEDSQLIPCYSILSHFFGEKAYLKDGQSNFDPLKSLTRVETKAPSETELSIQVGPPGLKIGCKIPFNAKEIITKYIKK